MGRKEIQHYEAAMEDYADDDEFEEADECLSLLAKDSESTEETLATIIKALEDGSPYYNNHIVDNYSDFIHLFHQCLFSIEKGSSKEVSLAGYIIGFLALSTAHLGYDVASAILHKSLPLIYKRLKLPFVIDSTKTVSMLNCLTIINFLVGVGSNEEEEEKTQVSLNDVIWRKVTKILGEEKGPALLAYGFFLTSTNRPATIDVQTISYLCSMLDCDESKVRSISGQILGLIFETYVLADDVRQKVLHKVNYTLAVEETKSQWNLFKKVSQFLDNGCLQKSKEDTWTDLIRMNFFKQFLGRNGFSQHMQKNQLLPAVLKVSSPPAGSEKRDGNYISRMGMSMKTVQRKKLRLVNNKRKILNKERTRSLEKGRMNKAATAGWMLL